MANYPVGDVVRVSATFTLNSSATDPTTITLRVKSLSTSGPGLNVYVYGSSSIVRDSAGSYHYDVVTSASGTYYYRWEGTGTVIAAAEGTFQAGPSYFL